MLPEAELRAALAERYTLERELGHGGMATVYLAEDRKHHRQVAIKVLRPELTAMLGAERFLKEIETTANLHHPHILPLFDSGQAASFLYYVMPFIDGESLRDRLTRERQLPVADALRIATETASALDYANRHGVIHRDIKPENILLHDGQALVADFGIALAVAQAGGHRLTETGLSLGTPHYMSPEQGAGDRVLDARSDVYGLACVLYEMLVGEPPYTGPTLQAITARKLSDTMPSLRTVRAQVPETVEAVIRRALASNPADRFASAAAFAEALGAAQAHATAEFGVRERRRRPTLQVALASILLLGGALAGRLLWHPAPVQDEIVRRTSILLPDSFPLAYVGEAPLRVGRRSLALSPDGQTLVYVGWYRGRTHLFVRPLDRDRVQRLNGTEGAYSPFFSPNGKWVAFFAGATLKKVALDGGAPVELASAPETYGGVWFPDGRIFFSPNEGLSPMTVDENGGVPTPTGSMPQAWSPSLLPGTDRLVTAFQMELAIVSLSDSVPLRLGPSGFTHTNQAGDPAPAASPQFLSGDYLLVAGDGRLHALPFSLSAFQSLGPLVPLDEQVRQEVFGSTAQFAVGGEGTLVYAPGTNVAKSVLALVDRRGHLDTLPFERAEYWNPKFSPNGRSVAVTVRVPRGFELQRLDLDPPSRTILFASRTPVQDPIWLPDGRSISVTDTSRTRTNLEVPASGGIPRRGELLYAISRNGDWKLTVGPPGIGLHVAGPGGKRYNKGGGQTAEWPWPDFSPDNKWVLWSAVGVRQYEVFVSALPPGGPVYSVTPDGCLEAYWMPDGREIVCLRSDGYLYAVPLLFDNNEVRGGPPRRLTSVRALDTPSRTWALSPDGQRMLFVLSPPGDSATVLTVVTNFRRVVEQKVAEARGKGQQ
jgi:hypothetical protein